MLETELLLAAALETERTWVLAHPEYIIPETGWRSYQKLYERRQKKEPIAYLLGKREFYGRDFIVNAHTLIPRPATEGLISLCKTFLLSGANEQMELDTRITGVSRAFNSIENVQTVVDVGTGTGCIAITLALEVPDLRLIATDVSNEALAVARENANIHHVSDHITFLQGDLLDPIRNLQEPFIIVSNPPYIPDEEELMEDVRGFEPHLALFAGEKGTDTLEKLITDAQAHPFCSGIILELRSEQIDLLKM